MNQDMILFALIALTIVAYGVSLIYVIGIVWRVEMELDVAYKFFAISVAFLVAAELFDVIPKGSDVVFWTTVLRITRLLAALNLLFGMFFMRDLIRKIDGERKIKN